MIDFLLSNLNNLNGLLIGLSIGAIVTLGIVIWNHFIYKKVEQDLKGCPDNDKSKEPASKVPIEDKKDAVSYPDYYQV